MAGVFLNRLRERRRNGRPFLNESMFSPMLIDYRQLNLIYAEFAENRT